MRAVGFFEVDAQFGRTVISPVNDCRKLTLVRRTEYADRSTFTTHYYISSAPCDVGRLAEAVRSHWGVESRHCLLNVAFKDDFTRYKSDHGAKNMTALRRFALIIVWADNAKVSIKTKAG